MGGFDALNPSHLVLLLSLFTFQNHASQPLEINQMLQPCHHVRNHENSTLKGQLLRTHAQVLKNPADFTRSYSRGQVTQTFLGLITRNLPAKASVLILSSIDPSQKHELRESCGSYILANYPGETLDETYTWSRSARSHPPSHLR